MPDTYLTARQVAEILQVSRHTVNRWVRLGQLEALRLPAGTVRIPRDAIDRLLHPDRPVTPKAER